MQPLCDALVELVVADVLREMETKNAVGPGQEHDGVEERAWKDYHSSDGSSVNVATSAASQ